MDNHVYKSIELTGSSPEGIQPAISTLRSKRLAAHQ